MHVQVIGFIPPHIGLEGEFNTFRLGGKMAKVLVPGQEVFLMDEKAKTVFGRAEVLSVESGKLESLCEIHAHQNHTELANEAAGAPQRLLAFIQKIFGPHIAPPTKLACVVYLRRIE